MCLILTNTMNLCQYYNIFMKIYTSVYYEHLNAYACIFIRFWYTVHYHDYILQAINTRCMQYFLEFYASIVPFYLLIYQSRLRSLYIIAYVSAIIYWQYFVLNYRVENIWCNKSWKLESSKYLKTFPFILNKSGETNKQWLFAFKLILKKYCNPIVF